MSELLAVGKKIIMPCMRKGLVAYADETINVPQSALDFMAPSARGIPVVIDHPDEIITKDNIESIPIVGRVSEFVYDLASDVWMAEFIVDDQEAVNLLQEGWGISTAWFGDKYASGGTLNNVGFDRELSEGRYEHLAIVKDPRYEMARNPIFLNSKDSCNSKQDADKINNAAIPKNENSKGSTNMIGKIFKIFTKREEISTGEGEEIFVHVDGSDLPLSKLVLNKKNETEKKEEKEEEKMANEKDMVDVDGEKITVNELVKRYKDACGKKKNESEEEKKEEEGKKENAEKTEEEEKAEEKVEKDIEQLEEDVEKEKGGEKREDGKKKNSKESDDSAVDEKSKENFEKIKSVHENGVTYELQENFISTRERVELGKSRYGRK